MFPIHKLRKAREAFYLNGFFWGVGNGLVSTSLIIYLIRDICSGNDALPIGTAIAWIIAAPRIVGLFRLFTPWLLERFGSKKRLVVTAFVLSPLALLAIPLGIPHLIHRYPTEFVLFYLGAIWAVYHVIEYFGSVTLWAWIGDLTPKKIRGRVFGVRERMIVFGQTLGWLTVGYYSFYVIESLNGSAAKWSGYFPPTYCGIACLLLAAIPILRVPEIIPIKIAKRMRRKLPEIFAPLKSSTFVRFLIFGIWLQIPGGLTQSVQNKYQMYVLGITFLTANYLQTLTRVGQVGLSPTVGRWIDRFGNFRIMSVSIMLVSCGSLFYFFATPKSWGLLFAAAFVWIFWVGVNIGISGTVLNLSPTEQKTNGVALFATATTLAFAISTMIGGRLDDLYKNVTVNIPLVKTSLNYAQTAFLGSFLLRLSSIGVLAWAMTPNASGSKHVKRDTV